jgi:hypothetical protein
MAKFRLHLPIGGSVTIGSQVVEYRAVAGTEQIQATVFAGSSSTKPEERFADPI